MQARSALWDKTVIDSHQMCVKVEVLVDGAVELEWNESNSIVTDGQTTQDRDDAIRGKGTLTLASESRLVIPRDANDLLVPYGTEWRPWRGIRFPNGTTEYKSLGIYIITKTDIQDTGDGILVVLDGQDRSRKVQRAKFNRLYTVKKDTPADQAIINIVEHQLPGAFEYSMGGIDDPLPQMVFNSGDDPWAACVKIAANVGCEVYFDENGVLTMAPVPDQRQDPVDWVFEEGENCTLLNIERAMEVGDTVYNHVIVTGEAVDNAPVVRAEAFDDNPDSPTFWQSKGFGDVPLFYSSKFIKTQAQAQRVANSRLRKSLGRQETITWNSAPNPAMMPGDIGSYNRKLSRLRNSEAIIDMLSMPLVADRGMQGISRRRPI